MVTQKPTKRKTDTVRKRKEAVQADPGLWRDLAAIGRRVPKEIRAELPPDLARNFDHYLDGSPKQD
jgi:hypothetical protein